MRTHRRRLLTDKNNLVMDNNEHSWQESDVGLRHVMGISRIHRVKWRHSYLWSHYDLYAVGQDGVLCEVKWWRFVALFE